MARKKTVQLKPGSKGSKDPRQFARWAREIQDRFVAQGCRFADSTQTLRADRDSR